MRVPLWFACVFSWWGILPLQSTIRREVDEGRKRRILLAIKMKARAVVGRGRYVTPDLSYCSTGKEGGGSCSARIIASFENEKMKKRNAQG